MNRTKQVLICGVAVMAVVAALSPHRVVLADDRPSSGAIRSAQETSDLMLATLLAALGQEFAETTTANVDEGKKSISLIFNDKNKDMRLVGVLNPLKANDVPQDPFEAIALIKAMTGQNYTDVQRVDGQWYYRRSVALSNFHPACSLCHANFGAVNSSKWVGALMLRVPVGSRQD